MLSYQHIYHAGNFADVHKHSLLICLLDTLVKNAAPLHVLDTHAGRGFYDLSSPEAQKTGEHAFGVTPLWQARAQQSGMITDYLDVIARYNGDTRLLRRYPGSARITRDMIRPGDTLIAAERHPGEFAHLSESFADADPATTDLFQDDGLLGISDAAPPPTHRGLAIIDPSYEIKSEYSAVPRTLAAAWRNWPQSSALLWYPILPAGGHKVLLETLAAAKLPNTLVSEVYLSTPPKPNFRMEGSGIVIVNCPWDNSMMIDLSQEIAAALTATKTCGMVNADVFSL